MDAIVQLVRNALCCIKDLQLFRDAGIHDAAQLPLPQPMDKTTRLEVLIGITQFYAFVSVSKSGWNLIRSSLAKLESTRRFLQKINARRRQQSQQRASSDADAVAMDLVLQRLGTDQRNAKRSLFVGVNVFCIGVPFFWLCANSFHVTETTWIGGLPALIHALTIMEIALVPLLYYMLADSVALFGKSAVMDFVAIILRKCATGTTTTAAAAAAADTKVPLAILTDETFSLLLEEGWTPLTPIHAATAAAKHEAEEKGISDELKNVTAQLESWTTTPSSSAAQKAMIQSTAARIESRAVATRYEAYREFVYFLLNFVAFYGYLLGILVYYRESEDDEPLYVRTLKLGMANADADWTGNFAGDLMWTIGESQCRFWRSAKFETNHVLYAHLIRFLSCFRTHDYPCESYSHVLDDAQTPKDQGRLTSKYSIAVL